MELNETIYPSRQPFATTRRGPRSSHWTHERDPGSNLAALLLPRREVVNGPRGKCGLLTQVRVWRQGGFGTRGKPLGCYLLVSLALARLVSLALARLGRDGPAVNPRRCCGARERRAAGSPSGLRPRGIPTVRRRGPRSVKGARCARMPRHRLRRPLTPLAGGGSRERENL